MIDRKGYYSLMGEQPAHLILKLDTAEPVEIGDFVGAFTSLANEFERYIEQTYPGAHAEPRFYVREVRNGCIEADLITSISGIVSAAITHMDQILILEDFVRRWGVRFISLRDKNIPDGELDTREELKDFYKTAKSISCDPKAKHRLQAATYENGKTQVKVEFEFSAIEARTVEQNIEDRQRLLAAPAIAKRDRVLMLFTRTDVHDAAINKKSGERVVIKEISPKEMPVMFSSEMAEQEIREYIREADENVYKRGFVVDVFIQSSGDRIIAYSVSALHSVIDLE